MKHHLLHVRPACCRVESGANRLGQVKIGDWIGEVQGKFRVIIIGGGIAGCSTLYHLATMGWSDIALVERDELTSGTTWHSAGQVTGFGTNQTMLGLKAYSIDLYRRLATNQDYPVDYNFADGGIRLASTRQHMDGYLHFVSMAKGMGVDLEVIDRKECGRRHPLIQTEGLAGGLWDPQDGHIDPSQLCQALAHHARQAGARVYRHTPVLGLTQDRDDHWTVHTPRRKFRCQAVVNASGYRVNEVAGLMGVHLPVVSMEHQYIVTGHMTDIAELPRRVPLLRCPTHDFYCRQEKQGLLVGFYEQGCKAWGLDGIAPEFARELLPEDYDRILNVFEQAALRMPALEKAGIGTVINGPITYSADGLPLVGRIPNRRNAWCIAGLRAGIGEGGGHGWLLAQLMIHGEACLDTWCLDPRRFGSYADTVYCVSKSIEDYQNEFRFHMPREHRPAGRPARSTKLTRRLAERGVQFAPINGWERSSCFPPASVQLFDLDFRRSLIDNVIREEVLHVHRRVGISEVCGLTRIEISGQGRHEWLAGLSCSPLPRHYGQVRLCYFLNQHGCVKSEATIANLGDRFWYCSAAAAELHDFEMLSDALPADESVSLRQLTEQFQMIVVAGPAARLALSLVVSDVSVQIPRWLGACRTRILGTEAIVFNLSYSGELAFELHVPATELARVWHRLENADAELEVRPFGLFAADCMRIEKGFRHWKTDLITEYDPFESGLGRFVDPDRNFTGARALSIRRKSGLQKVFRTLEIKCECAPAQPGTSIFSGDSLVGTVTSGGFGYRTGLNLAMGFMMPRFGRIGTECEIDIIGSRWPARIIEECPYDPQHKAMRS